MDKKVAGLIKDTMGKGEKIAPVKAIKLKVKFQDAEEKEDVKDKKKDMAKRMKKRDK